MSRSRFFGSLSRQLSSNLLTLAGTPSQRGSDWMTAARIDDTSSPSNARRPVSIS